MIITGKLYDFLKWLAQIVLPALGTLYATLAGLWGLPAALEVAGTILAVDTFLGIVLGLSQAGFQAQVAKGVVQTTVDPSTGKLTYDLVLDDNPETLRHKRRAVFDVIKNDEGLSTVELIGLLCLIGVIVLIVLVA